MAKRKGEVTRQAILDRAVRLASQIGLDGLTIGRLAAELGLSKSGLFAHFRSKEALQIQVLDAAAERFVEEVVKPAVREPRGEPRMAAVFDRWLAWTRSNSGPGGCVFVAAAAEFDDRPGPVRDRLVALQKGWLEMIAIVFRAGVAERQFQNVDPDQFAHDLYSVMLGYHHAARLMRDPKAQARAQAAFERLLSTVRAARSTATA